MTEFDPMDQDAQQEQQAETAKAAELAQLEIEKDFHWLMGAKQGRRIVWRMLAEAGVFHSGFDPDPCTHAFKAGRRDAGLKLLGQINSLCPDLYTTMMKEQLK